LIPECFTKLEVRVLIRSLLLEEKSIYARVCQSHKLASNVSIMELSKAQKVVETRRKLRRVYTLPKYVCEIKIDQNGT